MPVLIQAQSFWSLVDDNSYHNISYVTDKGYFQDSVILVGGNVSDASCPYYNLLAYNNQGKQLWNIWSICDVIKTDSNFIYTAGYDIGTDDISGDEYLVLAKYNNLGEEIDKLSYPNEDEFYDYFFEFRPQNIDLVTDGTILVSSGSSIIKSNLASSSIKEYSLILESQITAIHAINPISYLINTQNRIYKTDSSLTLVDSIEFENPINELLIRNDTIFTLFDSYLLRIDTNLIIIDTIFTSSVSLKSMEYYQNSLWIQINTSDSIKLISLHNLQISDTLSFPVLMNNTDFIVANNNYIFVGDSYTNQIGLCNFQIQNNEIKDVVMPDVELFDFDIDSIVIEYYTYQDDSFATGYSYNAELTVKNNSDSTLNSLAVFSDLHGGMNCAQNFYYQIFTGLNILPGQTETLNLRRTYEEDTIHNTLCYTCMAPNSALEIQTSDNSLCKTFTITGINDETPANLKVYPNPASNYIIIEQADFSKTNIEIIDIKGRVVINRVSTEQKIRIETSGLSKGLYLVKINNRNKINVQVIMKE